MDFSGLLLIGHLLLHEVVMLLVVHQLSMPLLISIKLVEELIFIMVVKNLECSNRTTQVLSLRSPDFYRNSIDLILSLWNSLNLLFNWSGVLITNEAS